MSLPFLQTIGLTGNESSLYELLLRLGEVPAGKLIAEAKIRRATAYKSLYSLEAKHLVTHRDVGKILHFRPEAPTKLLEFTENQHQGFDRAREDLRSFLPELTSSFILSVERPVVSTFEGVEGLKSVYLDTIQTGEPIAALVETSKVCPEIYAWVTTIYVRQRVKHNIPVRAIVASGTKTKQYVGKNEKELRESKIIASNLYPFEHEINIYGNKIAILNHRSGGKLIGIIIDHPAIARTFRSWFELTWSSLP